MGKFGKDNFDEGNKWRVYIKDQINYYYLIHNCPCKPIIINPNDYYNFIDDPPNYKTQGEVMEFDLYKLRMSNLVIVNFNDAHSLGTMAEIAIAYELKIPVVGLNSDNQKLHPWQEEICTRIFDNIDDLINYVNLFYLT